MNNDKQQTPGRRAPRKRSKSKRQARNPEAAQRNPGPPTNASSHADAPAPGRNGGDQADRPPAAGERADVARTLTAIPIHVRWRDLDAFNHVNNSSYLTFLEESRLQWLRNVPGEWFSEHAMPVMAAVELHYRKPITWPAEVDVLLSCERLGKTSLTIGNRIVDHNDHACVYADGKVVMVWIDPTTGASVPLPDAIRSACG